MISDTLAMMAALRGSTKQAIAPASHAVTSAGVSSTRTSVSRQIVQNSPSVVRTAKPPVADVGLLRQQLPPLDFTAPGSVLSTLTESQVGPEIFGKIRNAQINGGTEEAKKELAAKVLKAAGAATVAAVPLGLYLASRSQNEETKEIIRDNTDPSQMSFFNA